MAKRKRTRRHRRRRVAAIAARPRRHYRRSAAPRRSRRRRSSGGGGSGIKGVVGTLTRQAKPALIVAGAILGGRAIFGLIRDKQPDLHPGVAVAAGALLPGLAAVLLKLKPDIAVPLLLGGIAGAGVDIARQPAAEALSEQSPAISAALYNGMSLEPAQIPPSGGEKEIYPVSTTQAETEVLPEESDQSWFDRLFSLSGDIPWSSGLGQTYLMP